MSKRPRLRRRTCRSASRPTPCCRHGSGSRSEGQVLVSPGKVEIGQGIVTALAQIAADELDVDIGPGADGARVDRGQPERRRHLGQPLGAAIRPRHPPRLRRNPANLPCRRLRSARRRRRRARHQRRHDLGARQYQHQLLGARRRNLAGSRRDAGRGAEAVGAARACRKLGPAAGYSRQGFRASALHSRPALPGMLHGRVLRSELCGRETHRHARKMARAPSPAWSPSSATAISPASSAKPRTAPRPR